MPPDALDFWRCLIAAGCPTPILHSLAAKAHATAAAFFARPSNHFILHLHLTGSPRSLAGPLYGSDLKKNLCLCGTLRSYGSRPLETHAQGADAVPSDVFLVLRQNPGAFLSNCAGLAGLNGDWLREFQGGQ
jgi:hypothetical protein